MDALPEGLTDYLTTLLRAAPTYLSAFSYLTPLTQTLATLRSLLLPLVARLTTSPDIASIVVLIAVLYLSLLTLRMMVRSVIWWCLLWFKIALWGGTAVVILYVYNRGLEGAVEDVGVLVGTWRGEYEYWQEKAREADGGRDIGGRGYGGAGYGGDYGGRGRTGWR